MGNVGAVRIAQLGIIGILSSILVFHALVLVGVIPFGIVWGGRLKDHNQMVTFESVSSFLNGIMMCVVAIHARWWKVPLSRIIIKIHFGLWACFSRSTRLAIGKEA